MRGYRKLFMCRLAIGLEECPRVAKIANTKAHLGNVTPCRKYNGSPNRAMVVYAIAPHVIESPNFVALFNAKSRGDVGRALLKGSDIADSVDWQRRRHPAEFYLFAGFPHIANRHKRYPT